MWWRQLCNFLLWSRFLDVSLPLKALDFSFVVLLGVYLCSFGDHPDFERRPNRRDRLRKPFQFLLPISPSGFVPLARNQSEPILQAPDFVLNFSREFRPRHRKD